jgi:hypothetical protein
MTKILKNTTASIVFINDTGVSINASGQYIIPHTDYLLWAASLDYQSLVTTGTIVVNNGVIDLAPNDGIRYIDYADRAKVQAGGVDVTQVATTLNFTGSVTVTDNGSGKATVNVNTSATAIPCLREVVYVLLGGTIPMSVESNLLFEPQPVNDTILFLREEVL